MTTEQYLNILEGGGTPDTGSIVSYGLVNALTVMLVVFAVLGILFLILSISGAIFARLGKPKEKKQKAAPRPKTEKPTEKTPVSDEVLAVLTAAASEAQNDGELIAAITAAIHAAREESGETGAFRVVSFRRR